MAKRSSFLTSLSAAEKQPFGPRHLAGAGIIVVGVAGLAKLFIVLGHSHADRMSKSAQSPVDPTGKPSSLQQVRAENTRGQYRGRP
jgi:hypothetical protein